MPILSKSLYLVVDFFLALLAIPAAAVCQVVRRIGFGKLPVSKKVFLAMGVVPIRRHYYEPLFHPDDLHGPLDVPRDLDIDWNDDFQRSLLGSFNYQSEILKIPRRRESKFDFCFENGSFESGDADYLYSFIRLKKPKKIVEVGSGNSTLLARIAIAKNKVDDPSSHCDHICIEPYEFEWLESMADLQVIRGRVEAVGKEIFQNLESGDLLFIDSSHIIRPRGDVLCEILEILPQLKKGVYIHFHDVFSPRDYPKEWIFDNLWSWNEQYLLEALLTGSKMFKVIGALNYLKHKYPADMTKALPIFAQDHLNRQPGSFYIEKI
jgi:hypothetical protein